MNEPLTTRPRALRLRLGGITVFVYHGISDSADTVPSVDRKYWVEAREFQQQMGRIRNAGAVVLPMKLVRDGEVKCDNAVVLSFDDGRLSDFQIAFPQLADAGMPATFFVNSANVGTSGFATWAQLAEMQRGGMCIESHAHDHVNLASLTDKELDRQLLVSKNTIEDRLGTEVTFVAPPYGQMDDRVLKAALRAGYRAVCSARSIPARRGATKLDRVVLYRGTSLDEFSQYLERDAVRYVRRISRSLRHRWPFSILLAPAVDSPSLEEGA